MKPSKVLGKERRKKDIIEVIVFILMLALLFFHLTSTTIEVV